MKRRKSVPVTGHKQHFGEMRGAPGRHKLQSQSPPSNCFSSP